MTTTTTSNGRSLARAAYAAYYAQARHGSPATADSIAARLFPQDTAARRILRGAVSPLSTTDADLTGAMVANLTGEFLAGLAPLSASARLIERGLRLSLGPDAQIILPIRPAGAIPLGWVGEGGAIPVRSQPVGRVMVGPTRKMAAITVHTRELAKQVGGEDVFIHLMREDAAVSLDAAILNASAATAYSPAGLLNGITPKAATNGGGLPAMEADLIALAASVTAAGGQEAVFIAAPAQAEAIRIRKPELAGRVMASPALAAGTVIAIDPTALISAFGFEPEVVASADATIHSDTVATQISTAGSPNTIAAPVRSMFQTGSVAVRVILDVAFALRAPGRIAYVTGVTW